MINDVFLLAILIVTLIYIVYRSKESFDFANVLEPTTKCIVEEEGQCWAWEFTCPEGWQYNGYGECIKTE
jgi:heme/copper-type cytochrome/quinol oxidase subunit 2